VQKSLKAGEAAIEIIRTRYYDKKFTDSVLYIALIVRPETKGQPEMVVLPNGVEMENRHFGQYGGSVTRGLKRDSLKNGAPAYSIYWQPINEALRKQGQPTKIYIAFDGIYHKISLLALQNPLTKKYLLDEVEIHQVGSTKDIVKWQLHGSTKNTTGNPDAVLVGHPAYDLSQEAYKTTLAGSAENRGNHLGSRLENVNWKPLVGTEKEINAIAKTLQTKKIPVQTYMQANATEEAVKRVQFPRILHIATHGAFFEKESEAADREQVGNEANQAVEFSPMLRSGLVLAGIGNFYQAKDRPQRDDGFLTAYEAMNLNLDNTELVVLSACETGLGEAKSGEGVFGLQRGFQTAGAKTILMSLWSVDDAATQKLMTLFYTNWLAKKQSKRQAFKNAQEALRKTYPQPYYWGAFVMVGE
jgi:CHAT domain-containing protein